VYVSNFTYYPFGLRDYKYKKHISKDIPELYPFPPKIYERIKITIIFYCFHYFFPELLHFKQKANFLGGLFPVVSTK